jgi:hypothetical protein
MDNSITFHHHHNKIKLGLLGIFLLILVYLGFATASSYFSYYGGGQCRDVFDNQPLETRQKICCNSDHYNSSDTLCKIKCDAIDVNPSSEFCSEIKKSQSQVPLAQEIQKPAPLSKESPKCVGLDLINYDKNEKKFELKPSNPINIKMNVVAKDIQPKYFVYEFFTIQGNDIYSIKPISFQSGKTLMAVNPATYTSNGEYSDSMTALHNFFYKENLNDNKKVPQDVLVVTSIIDEKGNKQLQPTNCFSRITIDQTPTYCKSFKVSREELSSDESIRLSVESNSPVTYSYEFKFLNLKNYQTANGDKTYQPIAYQKVNDKNEPFTISKVANGNSKLTLDLNWNSLYQRDLNNKSKFPQEIRVEAYIKPYQKSSLEELVPCFVDFDLKGDDGIDNCEDISISGGTKNSDGSISLKSGQFITINSESKSKNIEKFSYTFHNLDNLNSSKLKNGVKDASPIYFVKSDAFEIEKNTSKTDSKSILISYEDMNKIDLATGSKPKNVQVRAFFTNSDNRSSSLNSKCVSSFKIE